MEGSAGRAEQLLHGGEGVWSGPPSVTERVNEASVEMDVVSPTGFLRVCRHSDAQLFSGWRSGLSVYDLLPSLDHLVTVVASLLRAPAQEEAAVVLSGCGTSGRLAFFLSRGFNELLVGLGRKPLFYYLVSGGDEAVIASRESAEDNPHLGTQDLIAITKGKARVLFVGITCGFSAGYVAGQLVYAMSQPHFSSVLLGFNPVSLARDNPIEKWDHTFKQVAVRLQQAHLRDLADSAGAPPRHYVLNPLVGPETLTGSSRMKGGSATKFLLETIFARAIAEVGGVDLVPSPSADAPVFPKPVTTEGLLQAYEITYRGAYNSLENVTPLMVAAGESLKQGGHVYYLSTGSIAVLTTIDASECPPTFGSKFTDVRAFVHNGWKNMGNRDGDLTSVSEKFHLSWDDFEKEALPNLTRADLVLFVDFDDDANPATADIQRLLQEVRKTPANLSALLIARRQQTETKLRSFLTQTVRACAVVAVPYVDIVPGLRSFGELAAKFALNAISTYAHVAIGKVYKNRMIDLSVSNTKLFHRSVNIVSELMGVSTEEATTCILRSIYLVDDLTSDITERPISRHLEAATTGRSKVVPLALILASTPMPVAPALEKLDAQPIVRKLIAEAARP